MKNPGRALLVLVLIAFLIALVVVVAPMLLKEEKNSEVSELPGSAQEGPQVLSSERKIGTLEYYKEFLLELKKPRYLVLNVRQFVELIREGWHPPKDRVTVILRHDVDHDPETAFKMAEMEHELGINASYYFRVRAKYNVLSPNVSSEIKQIAAWGFDVGLHYEDLYVANYNATKAIQLFKLDLEIMRSLVPVKTVCAHCNRADMPIPNFEMFKMANKTLKDFGLEAECYLTVLPIIRKYQHRALADNMGHLVDWIAEVRHDKPGWVVYLLIHPCYYRG